MFIVETNPAPETEKLLKRVERFIGSIPPHFSLFATLNPKRFEMFLNEIFYLSMHKTINPDFFALIRFYIAAKEDFSYCYTFNTLLLLKREYTQEQINKFEKNRENLPLDAKHLSLFLMAVKALENPDKFTVEDINAVKCLGWSDADIYDAIDHGAFLYKFSKILKAYIKN